MDTGSFIVYTKTNNVENTFKFENTLQSFYKDIGSFVTKENIKNS